MGHSNNYYSNMKTNDMIKLFLETYFSDDADNYKDVLREVIYTEDDVYIKKVIKSIFEFVGNSMPMKAKEEFILSCTSFDMTHRKPVEWLETLAVFLVKNSI